jgi:hypothetical protein
MLRNRIYYRVKPFIPQSLRTAVRRRMALWLRDRVANIWPIMPGSERPPANWSGWPEGKKFALVLTHDVDQGFVIAAKSGTKPVAAAVFFYAGKAALFKFAASDKGAQELRGSNLVMWEGIKRLARKGLKTLHFGRTSVDNDGLRRFKLSWGAEEELIEYFRFAFRPNMWVNSCRNASEFHNRLFRRLPLAVNRIAGPLIYPHLD